MGLILGILAVVAGVIGIKWSVIAIVSGLTAVFTFLGFKRE